MLSFRRLHCWHEHSFEFLCLQQIACEPWNYSDWNEVHLFLFRFIFYQGLHLKYARLQFQNTHSTKSLSDIVISQHLLPRESFSFQKPTIGKNVKCRNVCILGNSKPLEFQCPLQKYSVMHFYILPNNSFKCGEL